MEFRKPTVITKHYNIALCSIYLINGSILHTENKKSVVNETAVFSISIERTKNNIEKGPQGNCLKFTYQLTKKFFLSILFLKCM